MGGCKDHEDLYEKYDGLIEKVGALTGSVETLTGLVRSFITLIKWIFGGAFFIIIILVFALIVVKSGREGLEAVRDAIPSIPMSTQADSRPFWIDDRNRVLHLAYVQNVSTDV